MIFIVWFVMVEKVGWLFGLFLIILIGCAKICRFVFSSIILIVLFMRVFFWGFFLYGEVIIVIIV